jgi:hypothetical protein
MCYVLWSLKLRGVEAKLIHAAHCTVPEVTVVLPEGCCLSYDQKKKQPFGDLRFSKRLPGSATACSQLMSMEVSEDI